MEKEFNLSEKIDDSLHPTIEVIKTKDVKEFIRRLRARLKDQINELPIDTIFEELAGEDLI